MKSHHGSLVVFSMVAWSIACSTSSLSGGPKAKSAPSIAPVTATSSEDGNTPDENNAGGADPTDSNANSKSGGTSGSDTAASGPAPNINFGLMVNNLNCTFCHMEVHGTVISLGDAEPLRDDANGKVFGKWLVQGAYHADDLIKVAPRLGGIVVSAGVTQNYNNAGREMPVDTAGKPTFPVLDLTAVASKTVGTVKSSAVAFSLPSASKVYKGNAVLIGTAAAPIVIDRDVLIQGDLIIKGVYTGVGTIYATGNIYIPANLTAAKPAGFPYSDDPAAAKVTATAEIKAGGKDGLALAAAKNIFIGDLENYMDAANTAAPGTPAGLHGARLGSIYNLTGDQASKFAAGNSGVWGVYSWMPEAQYEQLYEEITPCWTVSADRNLVAGHHWGERTWNQVDAFLYAGQVIAGVDRASNWTLNGGMIAQEMHIVSGADSARIRGNTQCGAARINFDYRLQNGLQVLEQLAKRFPAKP